MSTKSKALIILTALTAIGVAGGIAFYKNRRFEAAHPKTGDITEAVYGLGRVESDQRFSVIIGVLSTVERQFVDEGDEVEKGAPLVRFDSGSTFRAPFRGTVTFVAAREGETAVPNTPILRLQSLGNRYIELSLEQEAALRVRKGQKAKVSFESLRGKVLEGEVTALFPHEDEFLAHVRVEGLEPNVLPGMTADVSVEIGTIKNATLIPLKAVRNGMVTVRKSGSWENVKVEIGHVDGLFAEVTGAALTPEDEIRVRKD